MAKRTAIIDIGSNSARIVIFEKSSRYGFSLICEEQSKVRIGEGAYKKDGFLQPQSINRAFLALQSFKETAKDYGVTKILCVATSALRDAPNGKEFVRKIKATLGLQIKIIDGKCEAKYGGIAASNLLPISDAITVDIGGGSTDIALIENGKVTQTYSLDLGTVRLKELFFDGSGDTLGAQNFIRKALEELPKNFKNRDIIGIGGSARSIGKMIMQSLAYPFDQLHGFSYDPIKQKNILEELIASNIKNLKKLDISPSRYDTIREGALIFLEIIEHIKAANIITSGVGLREGVFLSSFLKNSHYKFPPHINPSIVSITDRFSNILIAKTQQDKRSHAKVLAAIFQKEFDLDLQHLNEIQNALSISNIGKDISVYRSHKHSFYIASAELNYGFTHRQIILISALLATRKNGKIKRIIYEKYKDLLPEKEILNWYSFIYKLSLILGEKTGAKKCTFSYKNQTLTIETSANLYLAKESIKLLKKPTSFAINIKDKIIAQIVD
ncbi:MAG: Ppx/GppA family phosphatase [Campylobacterales bacterium]|nr:Ppx/GppA family phosphatase [Campylobacterales bacterium]